MANTLTNSEIVLSKMNSKLIREYGGGFSADKVTGYVAVFNNMDEFNSSLKAGKFNNAQYSIIFIGTTAYVFPKNVTEHGMGVTGGKIFINDKPASAAFINADLSKVITPNAYLNNWRPNTTTTWIPTTTTSGFRTTTTSTSTFHPQTEMPITVKETDGYNEINTGTDYKFTIKIDGRTSVVYSFNGTLSGYNALDNLQVVSFNIECNNGTIYYRENGKYYVLPKVTTWKEFTGYYYKSGAIYVLGNATITTSKFPQTTTTTSDLPTTTTSRFPITTTTSGTSSTTTPTPLHKTAKCNLCGYEYVDDGASVCPSCLGKGTTTPTTTSPKTTTTTSNLPTTTTSSSFPTTTTSSSLPTTTTTRK